MTDGFFVTAMQFSACADYGIALPFKKSQLQDMICFSLEMKVLQKWNSISCKNIT